MKDMKKQAYNPYLPLDEYVPDGEPYVFGDRVYIYGSHDYAGGNLYCPGDYVSWSASIDNLADWKYEGVSYKRTQDPTNKEDKYQLWAPDVVKGVDGKYYLYYCFSFYPQVGVAVSDSPCGPFEFYGHVHYPEGLYDGKDLAEYLPFDPGVLVDDDGRVYLYYGFSPKPGVTMGDLEFSPGAMVVELESDMVTMKYEPKLCVPGARNSEGTGFEGHAFYEASSIRKIGGKYYFVYSSELSHELAYAISDRPDGGYVYGGPIISNGDMGYRGNEAPTNMMGNNHGGIVNIKGEWYVFYHRQTHGTESSRQGCAEKIEMDQSGKFVQVPMTSCGLNGGPLRGEGTYPSAIACHLTGSGPMKKVMYGDSLRDSQPYIYEENHMQYIANITDGVIWGYKYFDIDSLKEIELSLRGDAFGELKVTLGTLQEAKTQPTLIQHIEVNKDTWRQVNIKVNSDMVGITPLYFEFKGTGSIEVKDFTLIK